MVHGIPKEFDPTSELSKANIAIANRINKEDIIRMRWLLDNMNAAKRAGSIVMSLCNKDLAEKLTYPGVFLDYDYYQF